MEYPREQLQQVFIQLPAELKTALFSEVNAAFIGQIAEKFHIPEEKIPLLAGQIGLVIMGLLPPQNLTSELKTVLNIDGQMSQAIAQEINFKIFTPIRLSLRKIHGLATPEEISMEGPTPPSIPAPRPTAPPSIPAPTPRPVSPPPPFVPRSGTTEGKPAPTPARPPIPAPAPRPVSPPPAATPLKPITPPAASASRPIPPQPRPFIPPRPLTTPPGIIVPKTITPPSPAYQRPAYESPALSPKPITPPTVPPPPAAPPTGGPPKPVTPQPPKPTTEPAIAPRPEISAPAEPIDLTKININDPRLEGNVVDLKNLE